MKTEYKRDLNHNYLVIEIDSELNMEEYALHMTEENQIPGLLPMQVRRTDGSCSLYYEITSCESIEQVYGKKCLSYQDIFHILSEIQNVLESVRRYLLNSQQILFDPRYVYVNSENSRIAFCYVPSPESSHSVVLFSEFLLKKLDHEDKKAVSVGYRFYQKATEENFSLPETLREIVKEESGERQKRKIDEYDLKDKGEAQIKRDSSRERDPYEKSDIRNGKEDHREEYQIFHRERTQKTEGRELAKTKKSRVYPVLLLFVLLSSAVLGVLLYLGWINLTEAGGIFFLILAAIVLTARFFKNKSDQKTEEYSRRQEETEDWETREKMQEKMKALRRELYQEPSYEKSGSQEDRRNFRTTGRSYRQQEDEDRTAYLAETDPGSSALQLVSDRPERYPPIRLWHGVLIVGKTKGQADILLEEAAVSRIHARLEKRSEGLFIRDLGSRNGTYLNGVRLKAQEELQVREGDTIIFANVRYTATRQEDYDRTQLL